MIQTEKLWHPDIQQQTFRGLTEAFSRPGTVQNLATENSKYAVLATLMDGETSLADPHKLLTSTDWPLLQAKQSNCNIARFILADGQRAPDFQPALGTLASPEFGATLLIEVESLESGSLSLTLNGPGIAKRQDLRVAGLHIDWITHRANWVAGFPLGVDFILCANRCIAVLPRTTQVSIQNNNNREVA